MAAKISKSEALTWFCLARQAERSIDFALSSERQWDLLRRYYDSARLGILDAAVESLKRTTAATSVALSRERAFRVSIFWVLAYPIRLILNRWRVSWPFQDAELRFLQVTFQTAIDFLNRNRKPETASLVQTRMDLYACEVLLKRKLVGLPEARQAERIEHFCQAPHIKPFKLKEIAEVQNSKACRLSA